MPELMTAPSARKRTKAEAADEARSASFRICRALRQEREAAGISQEELAIRMGVTQAHISRWETGREPRLDMVAELERCLGLPVGGLLVAAGYVHAPRMSAEKAVEADERIPNPWKGFVLASIRNAIQEAAKEGKARPARRRA